MTEQEVHDLIEEGLAGKNEVPEQFVITIFNLLNNEYLEGYHKAKRDYESAYADGYQDAVYGYETCGGC